LKALFGLTFILPSTVLGIDIIEVSFLCVTISAPPGTSLDFDGDNTFLEGALEEAGFNSERY